MDGGSLDIAQKMNIQSVLDDALSTGTGRHVANGKSGIVMEVLTQKSLPFVDMLTKTNVRTFIVKVLPFQELNTSKVKIAATKKKSVALEFNRQVWLDNKCKEKYGFSIFPTPISFETTTLAGLAKRFTFFDDLLEKYEVTSDAETGVIYMELVNSKGKTDIMSYRSREAKELCRRLVFMTATLGYLQCDFHGSNFFKSHNGYVLGDMGEARPMTEKEIAHLESLLPLRDETKAEIIKTLYGAEDDFTAIYFLPRPDATELEKRYVFNYQWFRSDAESLTSSIDNVKFASVENVRKSLGF